MFKIILPMYLRANFNFWLIINDTFFFTMTKNFPYQVLFSYTQTQKFQAERTDNMDLFLKTLTDKILLSRIEDNEAFCVGSKQS